MKEDQCHKIFGPPLEWGQIVNIGSPHLDFGAPFEVIALLARQEVALVWLSHAIVLLTWTEQGCNQIQDLVIGERRILV